MSVANVPLAVGLVTVAAGAVGYVVLMPWLSGEKRAQQRRKALGTGRSVTDRIVAVNRREQVAKSLKELDAKKDTTKISLEVKIARAGLDWSRKQYMIVSAILGLICAAFALVLTGSLLAAIGALFAGGFGLPIWILKFRERRRCTAFIAELPNAMDVIVRGLRSGIPLGDCLRIISREAKDPLRSEFRAAIESQAMGLSMSEAILRMYERVPLTEVNFFAVVIGIQQKSGGNLTEALGNLSRVLRERRKMAGRVQAMSMEAKASAAIIAALPFFVALITFFSSPDYVSLLWTTSVGQIALVLSAFWMSMGIFTMKKMISFDI